MARDENLTERVQVLLSKEDLNKLHAHLYQRAIEEGKKPESISSYLRITIKNLIDSFEKNKILSNE
jgi:hypothetical protein